MDKQNNFHKDLKELMDKFLNDTYDVTKKFPKDELFCLTSQLRRAALSIVLNYIEGYARQNRKVLKNFLIISYGSLKESKYLVEFSFKRKYLNEKEFNNLFDKIDQIGAMLWGMISKLKI